MQESTSSENKILAALGYPIWIVALIVLVTDMKQNRFMRTHAIQALGYSIAWFVIFVGLSIISALPFLGLGLALLWPVLWLLWLAGALFYGYRAYQGQTFAIPVVSQFTARYVGS